MLKSLHLENYRGFKNHRLTLRQTTVIVGVNNAGKSTLVEALRLVSLVTNRYRNLNYGHPPYEAGLPVAMWVASPSIERFNINFDNVFHLLGDPPAVITAEFTGGETIELYLTETHRIYAVVRDSSQRVIKSKAEANRIQLAQIHILPQVAPLARDEVILAPEYVRANMPSPLAPLHFRNQLRLLPDAYHDFNQLAEETWPGLRIRELVGADAYPRSPLGLLVQDGNFVAEVAWMGHGLQVWLQTIWFLARTPSSATVILDEPDVYLHPDLQRRVFRLVRSKYRQVIVATHSTEMMSEAEPHQVMVIDRTQKESRFADDHPTVQRLIDHIGSTHNISLARLRTRNRFLFVEGDDLDLLNHFHGLLFRDNHAPLATVPNLPLGGWGGWDNVIGSTMVLHNFVGERIVIYCLLDSDYHVDHEISERYDQARKSGVELHVWCKKEIENYLLVPNAISRVIVSRIDGNLQPPSPDEIRDEIDRIADMLREEVIAAFGTEFLAIDRKGGFSVAMRNAQHLVDMAWQTREGRWSRVPGKRVLSQLSAWSQKSYGVSFGPMAVLKEMREREIHREIASVVKAVENGQSLISIRSAFA